MANKDAKYLIFAEYARVNKALSIGNRVELLQLLAQGERSVEALARLLTLSIATTSGHLAVLRQAGFVVSRLDGGNVYYSICSDRVKRLMEAFVEVAQHNKKYRATTDSLEPVGMTELLSRMRSARVMVLDARPREEYEAGHLLGAVNMPMAELKARAMELPRRGEIVVYGRNHSCTLSFQAMPLLRRRGLIARRLELGFQEWKAARLPVE
jgi:DNA-binding transcriptional ArsR family regulator/rhodanese-related sulfurtransferase